MRVLIIIEGVIVKKKNYVKITVYGVFGPCQKQNDLPQMFDGVPNTSLL